MKYVALLRGINVGGNHPVPRAQLQTVFENLGFQEIVIYINSGNVVFASHKKPQVAQVQEALEKHFGFDIPTLILSGNKIKKIAAAIPKDWTNDTPKPDKSGQKSDVLYLFDEANASDVLKKLRYRPEVESMIYVDGAVLANISRAQQSKSSLLRVVGTPLYRLMTIRNIKTAQKLAELVED